MVLLTVVHDIMEKGWAKKTKTLQMFNTARIEYSGRGTVDGDKTNNLLFTVIVTM